MPKTGTAIVPADDPFSARLYDAAGAETVVTFGCSDAADVKAGYCPVGPREFKVTLTFSDTGRAATYRWGLPGRYQALNAAAAAAAARAMGVDSPEVISRALAGVSLPQMRFSIEAAAGVNWVNDAYNANPRNMRAGIEAFVEMTEECASTGGRRFLVLGEMLELGEHGAAAHAELLDWCAQFSGCSIVTAGEQFKSPAKERGVRHFDNARGVAFYLQNRLRPDDWVYLKGSRAVGLDEVLAFFA